MSYPKMDESRLRSMDPADVRKARVSRLKSGNYQFGHAGEHHGNGSKNCPRYLHHHCDEFCKLPDDTELIEAGVDPALFAGFGLVVRKYVDGDDGFRERLRRVIINDHPKRLQIIAAIKAEGVDYPEG